MMALVLAGGETAVLAAAVAGMLLASRWLTGRGRSRTSRQLRSDVLELVRRIPLILFPVMFWPRVREAWRRWDDRSALPRLMRGFGRAGMANAGLAILSGTLLADRGVLDGWLAVPIIGSVNVLATLPLVVVAHRHCRLTGLYPGEDPTSLAAQRRAGQRELVAWLDAELARTGIEPQTRYRILIKTGEQSG